MISTITSTTTDEEYAELVAHWEAAGCTMLPDTPQEIAFREGRADRHESNVLWLRKRVEESRLAACAAILVACFWASWEPAGCAASIGRADPAKVRQAMGAAVHADHDPLGVGENGKRAQRMRRDAEGFGTWTSRS